MRTIRAKKHILFSLILCLLLCTSVSAHPGGTDSDGGHTDHSSGEYHYHHGYPAHDHYDVDGDGDIDCPYEFHDRTSHDYRPVTPTVPAETAASNPHAEPDSTWVPNWGAKIAFICLAFICPLYLVALYPLFLLYRLVAKITGKQLSEETESRISLIISYAAVAAVVILIITW